MQSHQNAVNLDKEEIMTRLRLTKNGKIILPTVLIFLFLIVGTFVCNADTRVCINKNTGKLIESQSGGDDRADLKEMRLTTLKQNALNAGYKEDEIEVKWVTDAEWTVILADLNKPTPEQIEEKEKETLIQAEIREQAIAELIKEGKLDKDGKIVKK